MLKLVLKLANIKRQCITWYAYIASGFIAMAFAFSFRCDVFQAIGTTLLIQYWRCQTQFQLMS